ncbi:hypothetical protein T11_17215 [Trichinella zimbabwensis]|uniref:Uncharacterized protein n=1 Tax=Trichinella zimbabwensis TaxID=268475 RepID=A0A0V1HK89_9BILA|nr:hypothetical protein T11_17215 [Trichinella zimbabwensis]
MSTAGSNGHAMDIKNTSWSSDRETSLMSLLTNRCSSTTEINSDSDATLNGFEESSSIPTCTLPRVLDCQSCRPRLDFTDKHQEHHQHYHHLHHHHHHHQQQQQQQQQQISRSCNLTPKPNGGLFHSIRRLFKLSTNADIKTHWQFHSLGKLPSSTLHTAGDCNARSKFKQQNSTDGHQTITACRVPTKEKQISLKAISLSTHSEATFLNQSSSHMGGDQFANNSLFQAVDDDQQSKAAWNNANRRRASSGYGRLPSNFKRTETAIDRSRRLCNSRFPLCSRALSMNYSNQQHHVSSSPLNLSFSTNVAGSASKRAQACDSGASSSIITEIMQTPNAESSMMCQSTIGYICQNVPKRANLWWRRHGRCGANSKITWDNICIKSEQPSLVSRIATYYEASIQIGASEDVDVTVMIVALTHKNPIPKTRRLPFTLPYVFQIAEDIECRFLLNLNQGDKNYEEEEQQQEDDNDDEAVDEDEESVQNMRIPCTVYILPKSSVCSLSAAVKNQLDTIVKQESKDLTFLCKFKREICFLMTQLITVFKYLQSIGVEYATKEIEELVLLKIDSEDKPRLILEWDFVSIEERLFKDWQVEKRSLCKVASRILLAVIRTVSGMTCEDADEKRKNLNCVIDHAILKAAHVLIEEKADSLTRALCLMQYIVWVLPEKSLKPLLCEEQANEWIQSERTRLLCHLVKKLLNPLYEINVYDHYCLLFLLNASPKYLLYAEKLICETN